MAKKIINTGTTDNDGTGDSLKVGAGKINDNFAEIYTTFGDGTNLTGGAGGGAQGIKGNTGTQGSQGAQGIQGRIGANFNVFATEANVAITPPGNVQTFLNNTYPNAGIGSAVIDDLSNHIWVYQGGSVWLDGGDTSGAQGIAGQYAAQGLQGTIGIQGVQGVQGNQGSQGVQGVQGRDGINAGQGTQGAFGAQGLQATQGTQGHIGIQGPIGIQGDLGAYGPQGVQGNLGYGAQGFQGIIGGVGPQGVFGQIGTTGGPGPQGPQGLQGLAGQGVQGSLGVQGAGGPTGNTGTQGLQGIQGQQGTQGLQGTQGQQGIQGVQGLQGLQGVQGGLSAQGTQGTLGIQGVYGNQGLQGVQGRDGANAGQGTQGVQGVQGLQGISNQGVQGKDGESAGQGTQGTIASQGLQGTIGSTGAQGSQGLQGNQGTQGTQGIVGAQVTAKTYTFTATGGVYYVDGVQQDTLYLIRGQKYIFDGSAASSHPLRLSTDSGNTSAYTSGYTVGASNTHTFVVPYDAPDTLYYYCTSHANMGGAIGIRDLTANDLQGTQGLQGNQGLQGIQGLQGVQGVQGLQGISNQGVQGLTGGTGTQGAQGLTGSPGVLGVQGKQGVDGNQGTQGLQGLSNQGVQGTISSQGTLGTQGVQGLSNQGVQGVSGSGGDSFVNIADYGADTTATDGTNVTAINNAISALGTDGGTVYIPGGMYYLNAAISLGSSNNSIRFVAAGQQNYGGGSDNGGAVLRRDADDEFFNITNSRAIHFVGITFKGGAANGSGGDSGISGGNGAIYVEANSGCQGHLIENCVFHGIKNCITWKGLSDSIIRACRFRNVPTNEGTGSLITLDENGSEVIDQIRISDCVGDGSPDGSALNANVDGITITNTTNTIYVTNTSMIRLKRSYYTTTSWDGEFLYFQNAEAERASSTGFSLSSAGSGGNGNFITLDNCFSCTNESHGMEFSTSLDASINVTNPNVRDNKGHGILVDGNGGNTSIVNPVIGGNSKGSSGTNHGITIGSNINDVYIAGGRIGGDATLSGTGTQDYGIQVNGTTHSNIRIIGTNVTGNQESAGISMSISSGTGNHVQYNSGSTVTI